MDSVTILYLRRLAVQATAPRSKEDIVYALFCDIIGLEKSPPFRYSIYPQMSLKWMPNARRDSRYEVPDIGIGNFTGCPDPPFKLRFGVEAKRALPVMAGLPNPEDIVNDITVVDAFHLASLQAEDQAKAAYKNRYPLSDEGVPWVVLVGPYWILRTFGPFNEAQLGIRSHKQSDSGDYLETIRLQRRKPLPINELFRLGSTLSQEKLRSLLLETDVLAEPWIQAITT